MHKVTVGEWGNSLTLRLPKSLASEAGIKAGSQLAVILEGGEVKLRLIEETSYALTEMLDRITPENLHDASWEGEPIGEEE